MTFGMAEVPLHPVPVI